MSNLKENIKSLIARALKNPSDQAEADQIDLWLKESEENIKHLQSYTDVWEASEGIHDYRTFDSTKSWDEINNQMGETKTFTLRSLLKIAAVALVLFAAGFLIKPYIMESGSHSNNDTATVYDAPLHNKSHKLADNSQIWLSKNSQLKQVSTFESERVVSLDGQAFFDVSHDPSRKFVVKSGNETITVLGTEFSVTNENDRFEVFVKSGKVAVNTGKRNIELNPNDWLIKGNGDYVVSKKPAKEIIEWVGTKFNFDNVPLKTVLENIASAYGINITIEQSVNVSNCKITTNITDESIEEVFEELKLIAGLEYSISGNNYSVNSVHCK